MFYKSRLFGYRIVLDKASKLFTFTRLDREGNVLGTCDVKMRGLTEAKVRVFVTRWEKETA